MIETLRTIIRPYNEADIALIAPIFADPITMIFWPQPFSEQATAAWVRRAGASFSATGMGRMLVELRDSGAPIGDCGIVEAEINGRREYDLGYIIHHPYWRQGRTAAEQPNARLRRPWVGTAGSDLLCR
jgi:RimJ/RimL family protein N-acetyltransferase